MRRESEVRRYLEDAITEFKAIKETTNCFLEKHPMRNNSREYKGLIERQTQILEKIYTLAWILNIPLKEIGETNASQEDCNYCPNNGNCPDSTVKPD